MIHQAESAKTKSDRKSLFQVFLRKGRDACQQEVVVQVHGVEMSQAREEVCQAPICDAVLARDRDILQRWAARSKAEKRLVSNTATL
jgi:hypothetical protein